MVKACKINELTNQSLSLSLSRRIEQAHNSVAIYHSR